MGAGWCLMLEVRLEQNLMLLGNIKIESYYRKRLVGRVALGRLSGNAAECVGERIAILWLYYNRIWRYYSNI